MKISVRIYLVLSSMLAASIALATDSIIVKKDPRFDILSAKQTQINKLTSNFTSSGMYKGFRIQVVSTPNRGSAFDTQNMLLANFPDQKSYVLYQSPNFRVRIGNFLKREEAENFRKLLLSFFPNGAYIVEDTVEYTPPEDEEIIF
jgi:hypothetical protein